MKLDTQNFPSKAIMSRRQQREQQTYQNLESSIHCCQLSHKMNPGKVEESVK